MKLIIVLAAAAIVVGGGAVQAQESALALGKSTFGARCTFCHGEDGKGGGDNAALFATPPADLTKLSERAGGAFPFSTAYKILNEGMERPGHGKSEMPVWGEYFIADALIDRGVSSSDAEHIKQGRILSVVYYLESIQD